jgi:hypothetical protein
MKRTLCSPLVATLAFGSVLADAPKSKNAKVTVNAASAGMAIRFVAPGERLTKQDRPNQSLHLTGGPPS